LDNKGVARVISNPTQVLFVHVKLPDPKSVPSRHGEDETGTRLLRAQDAIEKAFSGAPVDIWRQVDCQSFFVKQDPGFPYLFRLLEELKRYGLHFVACELGQNGPTLLQPDQKLAAWLLELGIGCRYLNV
jgi:hypothetical protein